MIGSFPKSTYRVEYFKLTYGLSGNDYRVATLPKAYLIVIGIIMQSVKLIGQF